MEKFLQGPDIPARIAESAAKISKATSEQPDEGQDRPASAGDKAVVEAEEQDADLDVPAGPPIEDDVNSGIYPYNAYTHPFTVLKRPEERSIGRWATRLQRLLIPSIMPVGLDPHQTTAERNRLVEARIEQRIREQSSIPVTMGEGGLDPVPVNVDDEGKETDAATQDAAAKVTLDSLSS